jgi:hypothetical protein
LGARILIFHAQAGVSNLALAARYLNRLLRSVQLVAQQAGGKAMRWSVATTAHKV